MKGQIRFGKFHTKIRKELENHVTQMNDKEQQLEVTNQIISTIFAAILNGSQETAAREKSQTKFAAFLRRGTEKK